MTQTLPTPDPHFLLPPLLASLPTSFASSRPPPDFLTLLSPILRQRLQINTSIPSSDHDSWLRLLCWDAAKADKLKDQVENATFEPHPVSGELELGDIDTIRYKRLDAETMRAQIPLIDWDLTAVYLWCAGGGGDNEAGWRLTELLPFDLDMNRDSTWSTTLDDAEQVAKDKANTSISGHDFQRKLSVPGGDEDYWAMYDQTPGRTPARHGSINPPGPSGTDDDYYAQYGNVQPAMDGHDPDENYEEAGGSTLNGNALQELLAKSTSRTQQSGRMNDLALDTERLAPHEVEDMNHPVPASPSSRAGSDTVAKLETAAEKYVASEIGIRQHISTTIKSMYRLAKSSGMTRDEFDAMVQRELETLSIFDVDD